MAEATTRGTHVTAHTPVLLQEVIDALAIAPGDRVVDGTTGGGGHAEAILRLLGPDGRYLAIDRDDTALERVQTRLGSDERVAYACGDFRALDSHAHRAGMTLADKILLDLGLSSDQLTPPDGVAGRGFSFARDEPLLMTMEAHPDEHVLTAYHVVNEWGEESLADIIYGFGGERHARRIARAIVEERTREPIATSARLADVVERVVRKRGPTHPATKTFQAIRMAVNDELGALEEALTRSIALLAPGGRLAVITFHSLEDRIVKHTFAAWAREGLGTLYTKRPVAPSKAECATNRRARSAKLRTFIKAQAHQ